MSGTILYGGDRNWSTWTMRVWLILKRQNLQFEEVLIRLRRPETRETIRRYSPSGWLPALRMDGLLLWDSLAIAEYLAERFPGLWPEDGRARAMARSACGEMHSGFSALREQCPMDLQRRTKDALRGAAIEDARRVVELWKEMRDRFGADGPFMFGKWSIADAYYTPVATRFRTYGIDLRELGDDGSATAYVNSVLSTPEFIEWERQALADDPD